MRAETYPTLPTSSARVQLRATDGRVAEEFVEAATGTPRNPMSDDDLLEKFLDLVGGRFTPVRAKEIASQALRATELSDVRQLTALLTKAG